MKIEQPALAGGIDTPRSNRKSMSTPQALVIGFGMAFDMMLIIRGTNPWSATAITLTLAAGLMLVTTGRITWMRSALARVFSTDAPQMNTGPAGSSQHDPSDSGLPTISDGRRL